MSEKELAETLGNSEYSGFAKQLLAFYVPLSLSLPLFRDNPELMKMDIKAVGKTGISDVVTASDIYVQQKIKEEVNKLHPEWQFWGEEGKDNLSNVDRTKPFLLITDPIEGTNNFRAFKDAQWGSVIALVDNKTGEPVIGIIAHPSKRKFYVGIKGQGVKILSYDVGGNLLSVEQMSKEPEYNEFTYNNSPHFNPLLTKQVEKFLSLGTIEPHQNTDDDLEKSRHKVTLPDGNIFVDPESGALEVVRYRGTLYFKTSAEMAAVFVIMQELGGKVTDTDGLPWKLGINTLIAARNEEDYQYLKNLFNRTLS